MSLEEIEKEIAELSSRSRELRSTASGGQKLANLRKKLDDAEILQRATIAAYTTPQIVKDGGREREPVDKRHIVFALLRQAGLSYPRIGEICGGFDHGTVMHGIRRIQQLAVIYPETRSQLNLARERFARPEKEGQK